jgi:four helix bundle suffix protein
MNQQPYSPDALPLSHLDYRLLLPLFGQANAALARYDGLLQSIPNQAVMLSPLTTQEAVLSSRIDGTQDTVDEVLEQEKGLLKKGEKFQDIEEIFNYRQALCAALEHLKDDPIRLGVVRELHRILMARHDTPRPVSPEVMRRQPRKFPRLSRRIVCSDRAGAGGLMGPIRPIRPIGLISRMGLMGRIGFGAPFVPDGCGSTDSFGKASTQDMYDSYWCRHHTSPVRICSMAGFIPPHGRYEDLLSFRKARIVYDATVQFTQRFLEKRDRTVDQMIQAARSGKQNILEGCMASGTSKETEIKLVNVARASLEELLEDYRDFLRTHGQPQWEKNSAEALFVRRIGARSDASYQSYQTYIETRPPEIVANILICLIHQTNYLLDQQLRALEKAFLSAGGLRERMTRARLDARRQQSQDTT